MRPLLPLLLFACLLRADGPADNVPEKVRPVPPKGVAIPDKDRAALTEKLKTLKDALAALPQALEGKQAALLDLTPDVAVFARAVEVALGHDEFFAPADVGKAHAALAAGLARAKDLAAGKPTWPAATGLVVRGYVSKIDGTVQPYGLVVPPSYRADGDHAHRLDVWLHGRYENVTELKFIDDRGRVPGPFTPRGAFVLHPFGRFSNAFKLAGEVDVLEALAHAQRHYRIDEDRVVMRGFSMGGAGCWQMAAHYPGKWAAAAPGAGFSETAEFLKVFQREKVVPTWYEQKLWQLYDCPAYAMNFHNLPVVVYSGEKDSQKQAADIMEPAFAARGMRMVHLIGPGTGHSYHPATREQVNARIDRLAAKGRERVPRRVRFTTPTLRYQESHWVRLDGLEEHWKHATIDAAIQGGEVAVKAANVSAFTLRFAPGDSPFTDADAPALVIDGTRLKATAASDQSFTRSLVKGKGGWTDAAPAVGLVKKHGLQGPIDDAFLDRFLIVRPTGAPLHEKTGAWAKAEMGRAIREWRRQMRGDALVKDDRDVTDADIRSSNLILWGDPSSNAVLAKVLDKLPLTWTKDELTLGGRKHAGATTVPVMVYPNPLNPGRYVVLNSGFTYREYDYL
ncbi:MAG: prolyl oligopeptidase family serine peptidase, partial [Gemmataceae bacterium]